MSRPIYLLDEAPSAIETTAFQDERLSIGARATLALMVLNSHTINADVSLEEIAADPQLQPFMSELIEHGYAKWHNSYDLEVTTTPHSFIMDDL